MQVLKIAFPYRLATHACRLHYIRIARCQLTGLPHAGPGLDLRHYLIGPLAYDNANASPGRDVGNDIVHSAPSLSLSPVCPSTLHTSCQGIPESYQASHFNSKRSSTWLQACHCPLRRGDNLTRMIGGGHSSLECALWPLCSLLLL